MAAEQVREGNRGLRIAVLAAHYPPDYSGAGIQLAALIGRLRERGLRFSVLAPRVAEPEAAEPALDGIEIRRFRAPRAGRRRELVFGLRAAFWLLRHRQWDLLHTVDFSYQSLAPWLVARLLGRPVLVKTTLLEEAGAGSLGTRALRLVRRLGYQRADAVVALSDALEARLREGYRVRGRILRIPNGVDAARFRPAREHERRERRRALGIDAAAFVPVLCGMRIARKDPVGLLEAASRLQHRPVHVLLVGPEGPDRAYEDKLRATIRRLPQGVRATILESLSSDGVAETLRAADVYVLPSQREGLPNSLLEAMATGLPCVATDIPGSRDVLEAGGGVLVPLGEDDALARTLDRLAAEPAERERLGREALRAASERYALEQVATEYRRAYATLLARQASGDAAAA